MAETLLIDEARADVAETVMRSHFESPPDDARTRVAALLSAVPGAAPRRGMSLRSAKAIEEAMEQDPVS